MKLEEQRKIIEAARGCEAFPWCPTFITFIAAARTEWPKALDTIEAAVRAIRELPPRPGKWRLQRILAILEEQADAAGLGRTGQAGAGGARSD